MERLHYDWSDLTRIVITDTDSNVWGGRSGYLYTLTARPDGRTDIDEVVPATAKPSKAASSASASASAPSSADTRSKKA
jgi:hypothetical protein